MTNPDADMPTITLSSTDGELIVVEPCFLQAGCQLFRDLAHPSLANTNPESISFPATARVIRALISILRSERPSRTSDWLHADVLVGLAVLNGLLESEVLEQGIKRAVELALALEEEAQAEEAEEENTSSDTGGVDQADEAGGGTHADADVQDVSDSDTDDEDDTSSIFTTSSFSSVPDSNAHTSDSSSASASPAPAPFLTPWDLFLIASHLPSPTLARRAIARMRTLDLPRVCGGYFSLAHARDAAPGYFVGLVNAIIAGEVQRGRAVEVAQRKRDEEREGKGWRGGMSLGRSVRGGRSKVDKAARGADERGRGLDMRQVAKLFTVAK